jgi:hypothetical protein
MRRSSASPVAGRTRRGPRADRPESTPVRTNARGLPQTPTARYKDTLQGQGCCTNAREVLPSEPGSIRSIARASSFVGELTCGSTTNIARRLFSKAEEP